MGKEHEENIKKINDNSFFFEGEVWQDLFR